jgi:hypothetical protein
MGISEIFIVSFCFGIVFFGTAAYYLLRIKKEKELKEKEDADNQTKI